MKRVAIGKESWHYQLLDQSGFSPWRFHSICPYFWMVVLTLFMWTFFAGLTLAVVTAYIGVWFYFREWLYLRMYRMGHHPKKTNILFEFVKAKKNNVCPLIEFE